MNGMPEYHTLREKEWEIQARGLRDLMLDERSPLKSVYETRFIQVEINRLKLKAERLRRESQ